MKNKTKTLLKFGFISLGILLFVTNCQKDVDSNAIQTLDESNNYGDLNITISSWEHEKANNNDVDQKINRFFQLNNPNNLQRTEGEDFYFDESQVQIIETEDYTSFTFTINRNYETPNLLENYMFIRFNDTTYKQYIIGYPYTIDNENNINYDYSNSQISEFNDDSLVLSRGSCVPEFVDTQTTYTCFYTNCSGAAHHPYGVECPCGESEDANCIPASLQCESTTISIFEDNCSGSNGSNSSGNTGPSSGSNGGGNGSPVLGVPLFTLRINVQLKQKLSLGFGSGTGLTQNEIDWIDNPNNLLDVESLNNYLEDNKDEDGYYPQEILDFVLKLIKLADIGNNNNLIELSLDSMRLIDENNYPGMNDSFPFGWWNDNEFIINSGNLNIDEQTPNAIEAALFALYPDQAILHIQNSITALNKAEELVTNETLTGIEDGKADAFRHAYWNALGTAEFGSDLMKAFADAHEWGETGLAVTMDFHNNHKGRIIGGNYNDFTSDSVISTAILQSVYTGNLKYINNAGQLVRTNL